MKGLLLTTAIILGLSAVSLQLAVAQTPPSSAPRVALGPADTYFVTQTSLGNPFRLIPAVLPKPRGRPNPFGAMQS
jgi:hypothetical protein